jgi:hypothetical protein
MRLLNLSAARQRVVRVGQRINHGQIRYLFLQTGDPVFCPPPSVVVDLKLDAVEPPRPEVDLADFVLSVEVMRLMSAFDVIGTGVVESIDFRAGLPRRLTFRLDEALR